MLKKQIIIKDKRNYSLPNLKVAPFRGLFLCGLFVRKYFPKLKDEEKLRFWASTKEMKESVPIRIKLTNNRCHLKYSSNTDFKKSAGGDVYHLMRNFLQDFVPERGNQEIIYVKITKAR